MDRVLAASANAAHHAAHQRVQSDSANAGSKTVALPARCCWTTMLVCSAAARLCWKSAQMSESGMRLGCGHQPSTAWWGLNGWTMRVARASPALSLRVEKAGMKRGEHWSDWASSRKRRSESYLQPLEPLRMRRDSVVSEHLIVA